LKVKGKAVLDHLNDDPNDTTFTQDSSSGETKK